MAVLLAENGGEDIKNKQRHSIKLMCVSWWSIHFTYIISVRKVKHISGFMSPFLISVYETIMRFGTHDMDCFPKLAKTSGRYT